MRRVLTTPYPIGPLGCEWLEGSLAEGEDTFRDLAIVNGSRVPFVGQHGCPLSAQEHWFQSKWGIWSGVLVVRTLPTQPCVTLDTGDQKAMCNGDAGWQKSVMAISRQGTHR